MKRTLLKGVCAAVIMTAGSISANAATVDPDAFAAGTVLDNAFAGVTLSIVGDGFGSADGSSVIAIDPSAESAEPFSSSTGSLSFGHTSANSFPHLFREPGFKALRADFSGGASSVSIDFISNDSADTGLLQAFSATDVLLGTYTTASLGFSAFETMTLSGIGNISYILASGDSGASSGGLDNLSFVSAAIPLPAAGWLLLGAVGGLGFAKRRKRRAS